jgi:hypothetical protein
MNVKYTVQGNGFLLLMSLGIGKYPRRVFYGFMELVSRRSELIGYILTFSIQPDVERQYYGMKARKTDASSCLQS